ncbi:MAG: DMT family transporter [Rhodobacteraceae bacterium]|nr:DMT family transporter [Paracoccaceae bacterium]
MTLFNFILAMAMGAAISIYLPMIAQSARILGAPILGNVPFFGIAFATSILLALGSGHRLPGPAKLAEVPAWLFLAGIVSALMIVGSSYLVPRIGTGALFVLLVAGQIIIGAVINQYGLLGVPAQAISAPKLAGTLLVLAGAVLVSFGDKLFAK